MSRFAAFCYDHKVYARQQITANRLRAVVLSLEEASHDSGGLAANGMVAEAANAGVRHFLSNPYTADAMLGVLAELLTDSGDTLGDASEGT